VSISLLLVSKSDFRVAERQARYFPAKSAYSEKSRQGRCRPCRLEWNWMEASSGIVGVAS